MASEIWGGFVMALRRWPTMFLLAGLIAVACAVLSIALGDVLSQVTAIRGVEHFRERHAVTFTPYYARGFGLFDVRVGDNTVERLTSMIDRQEAYTAIVNNMRLNDPNFADGHATLALFGDAAREMLPEMSSDKSTPLPLAMRGAKLADQNIDYIEFAGVSIPVVKTLPTGASFFDANFGVISLDNRIVIQMPTEMFPLLDAAERQEALHRAVLFAPADEAVDKYVLGCTQGGLYLVPQDTVALSQRFNEFLMVSAMYIAGMLASVVLVLLAFVASAHHVMRQEMRAFKIREMCGATTIHMSLRIGSFLAVTALVLPVGMLSFFLVMGGPYATAASWIMLALIVNFVFLWLISVRQVRIQEKIR